MTLLETVIQASATHDRSSFHSEYPVELNVNDSLSKLYPKLDKAVSSSLATPLIGWEISSTSSQKIEVGKKFCAKLNRRLKDTKGFKRDEFLVMLRSFLESYSQKFGIFHGDDASPDAVPAMIQRVAPAAGRDVVGMILEACIQLEVKDLMELLIVNDIVDHSHYPMLLRSVVPMRTPRLVCLALKHAPDFFQTELLSLLKYFLSPTKEAYLGMLDVLKEWESQAQLAIDKVRNTKGNGNKANAAKDASILLMVAYDGFSRNELCLHCLIASPNVDDAILSSCIRGLNGKELLNLIRYLKKWLKKYERFPQAVACPGAASAVGVAFCEWVPKVEDIVRWLGVVVDESFTSIVLQSEFHEELKDMKMVVDSMVSEAKDCCFISNVIEGLKARRKE